MVDDSNNNASSGMQQIVCSLDNALFLLSHLLNYKAADRQLVYTVNIIDSYQESEVSPVGY